MSGNDRGAALLSRVKKIRQLIAGFFGTLAQHCADPQHSTHPYSTVRTFVKRTSGSFIVDESGRRATVDDERNRRNIKQGRGGPGGILEGPSMLNSDPGEVVE
jgi:hypothetical protein